MGYVCARGVCGRRPWMSDGHHKEIDGSKNKIAYRAVDHEW